MIRGAVVGLPGPFTFRLRAGRDDASTESNDGATDASDSRAQSFVTRPDLAPPQIEFTDGPAADRRTGEEEYYFLSPGYEDDAEPGHGAGIYDAGGELVWIQQADREGDDNFFDVRVQHYQGEPVLTCYRGPNYSWGNAEITVLDDTYEEIATVTTGGEVGPDRADFHDTTITDRGTMLLISYYPTPMDLTEVGGPS